MTTRSSSRPSTQTPVKETFDVINEDGVATFYRQATPGTTYVRCYLPAKTLGGQCLGIKVTDLDWDIEKDQLRMPRHRGNAAVWQFLGDEWRSRVAWGLQATGVRTLMDVDDNYTVYHVVPKSVVLKPWRRTIKESLRPGETGYSTEMHRKVIPTLDGVIVSTPYLRDVYLEYLDDVFLCPNGVDPDEWQDLEEKPDDVLRIVYTGSMSHTKDAPTVTKALKWAARQPGVEVWLQGVSMPWSFARSVSWVDSLADYRRTLGAFHVGVAPLVSGPWPNGKSDLKALEYTMAGVLPIVAREEPYRPWWGFEHQCVEMDENAWLDAIKWVVKNRDAVPELLARSSSYVMNERTMSALAPKWKEALDGSA